MRRDAGDLRRVLAMALRGPKSARLAKRRDRRRTTRARPTSPASRTSLASNAPSATSGGRCSRLIALRCPNATTRPLALSAMTGHDGMDWRAGNAVAAISCKRSPSVDCAWPEELLPRQRWSTTSPLTPIIGMPFGQGHFKASARIATTRVSAASSAWDTTRGSWARTAIRSTLIIHSTGRRARPQRGLETRESNHKSLISWANSGCSLGLGSFSVHSRSPHRGRATPC